MPKISVVMPVYNGERYLPEAVESILNQSFSDFEFIIIDDGSTDNSGKIIAEYARQDERIVPLQNQENLGLTKSLNKGIARARGDYIARQDADDISLPERFNQQVNLLDSHPEVVLVSCNIETIDAAGQPLSTMEQACPSNLVAWYLLFYNRLAGHSQVMFRRQTVNSLGGYCETYPYCEDYELWCRMARSGSVTILPEVLLQLRFHDNRISIKKQAEQNQDVLAVVRLNLKELIDRELSLAEIENLKNFWLGYSTPYTFPHNRNTGTLNRQLKLISRAFVQKSMGKASSDLTYQQLQIAIGQRFIHWAEIQSLKKNFFKKIELLFYAFSWYPWGTLQSGQKSISKIPARILTFVDRSRQKPDSNFAN